jgi:Putative prokaryotic signal transducing protein
MENNRQQSESASRLVVVLETNNQIQLAMAKGLLEHAGIPFFSQGQFAALYQNVDGFLHKWVRLQVPEDRAAEALEVLELVRKPRPYLC